MVQIALHTVLKPGAEEEYERTHNLQPLEMTQLLRKAGVRTWRIYRDGIHLFHVIEVDDPETMRQILASDPINTAWDNVMSGFVARAPQWSEAIDVLRLVWAIPDSK